MKLNMIFGCLVVMALSSPSHALAQDNPTDKATYYDWAPGEAQPRSAGSPPTTPHEYMGPPTDARRPAGRRVPAIDPNAGLIGGPISENVLTPPPPVNLLSDTDSVLSARETRTAELAKGWIDGGSFDPTAAGEDGAVVFRFGAALPTVVCAPLYVCDMRLQPGETVYTVQVGDPVRWKVSPAISGPAERQITHVTVKPLDIGLTTNLLVTTDRRSYTVKLVSRKDDWMPVIGFSYPEDEAARWAAIARQEKEEQAATVIPATGQHLADLDFGYSMKSRGRPAWQPLRVYTDGVKTYIQFPASMAFDESPVLVAIGADRKEQMVNYRTQGNTYVVDKVLNRALLLSGVGRRQARVEITRKQGV